MQFDYNSVRSRHSYNHLTTVDWTNTIRNYNETILREVRETFFVIFGSKAILTQKQKQSKLNRQ